MDLIRAAVAKGLAGMEQIAGIPGSVGGALRMNAGAFGQEVQNVVNKIYGYRLNGTPVILRRKDISFGYRSAPELEDVIICAGRFQFSREEPKRLLHRVEEILTLRAKKQPLEHPSCGSVFKRPKGYYAGALIEGAKLKGTRIGDAMVSPKHSGFIVNLGNASAQQIYRLIQHIEKTVWERFGVRLEREVKLVGSFEEE
jgi:UDP-N-acetylmuramate dehydrogenase